jgi:hypothetical protein
MMPFFLMIHNWMLTVRLHRIPLDKQFLGKYAVNSLSTAASQQPAKNLCSLCKDRQVKVNPNFIPINHNRKKGDLSRADENQDLECDSPIGNRHSTDKDNHHHKHTEC